MKNQDHKKRKSLKNQDNLLKNQLARALADYDNLRKRSEEERNQMYKLASVSFMSKILPVIDNLKSAQEHIKDSGIAIIIAQLESLAKEEGFQELKIQKGDLFDENTMEVVDLVETENQMDNNTVSEIVLSGWKYSDGTIVRHSKVKVFKLKGDKK